MNVAFHSFVREFVLAAMQASYRDGAFLFPVVETDAPVAYVFLSREDFIKCDHHPSSSSSSAPSPLPSQLCHPSYQLRTESAAHLDHLVKTGWLVVPVPFYRWRLMSSSSASGNGVVRAPSGGANTLGGGQEATELPMNKVEYFKVYRQVLLDQLSEEEKLVLASSKGRGAEGEDRFSVVGSLSSPLFANVQDSSRASETGDASAAVNSGNRKVRSRAMSLKRINAQL
jgi:hypothetical protein